MSRQLALRLGTLVVILAAFFGVTTQATAAPQQTKAGFDFIVPAADPSAGAVAFRTVNGQLEMAAVTVAGPDDVTIQASHKFNRAQTERIYSVARAGGAAGLGVLCAAIAPGWVKAVCPVFVAVVLAFIPDKPPAGRCLEVYTKWTRPFLGVRYVNC
jgi:hypothetical protein